MADRPEGPSPSTLADLSVEFGLPSPMEDYLDVPNGTRLRYASWPAQTSAYQGTILYLNGRTEFIEKTPEIYGILCQSGFDVWTLDWRGQGLSTRPLTDPDKGHVDDFQHYLDDLHALITGMADLPGRQGRRILLGHSMGGHLGLRYLHDHPEIFDAAAFSAPMIDISVNTRPLRLLNGLITGLGFGRQYALGTGPFRHVFDNPLDPTDNGAIDDYRDRLSSFRTLSHDLNKRMAIEQRVRDNKALALGGPTAAWLDAAFRSINLTWSPGYAESIRTPVLMVGGGQDRVVVTERQEAMAKRLAKGRFHLIEKAAHELFVECDDVRFELMEAIADFADVEIDQPAIDMSGCVRD